jgi:flagellar hook protein FlgE
MSDPFRIALSGLNAASSDLRVIGNNVANASTTGFKKSRTEFQDVFAAAGLGASSNTIGSGVSVAAVAQQFAQGNVSFTDNNLDLAISGQGFFRLNDNGTTVYTRAGNFGVDNTGYIVNPNDQRLTGYLADSSGAISGALGDIQLDTSDIAPQATSTVTYKLNLNASATVPQGAATSSAISLGSAGANPVLDTAGSPVSVAIPQLVDNYGQAVTTGSLQFTDAGGGVWNATLTGTGGTSSTAAITIGTTNSVTLNWDPDGGAGAQTAVPITIDVSALTENTGGGSDVTAAADGSQQSAFDVTDASSFNNSTSLTIYDSLGASHLATTYYRKTDIPNQWETYLYVDGTAVPGAQANGSDLLQYASDGTLSSINGVAVPPNTITSSTFSPGGGAADMTLTMNYADAKQFGGGFSVNSLVQDGFATGRLSGIDIDSSGVVLARFTNGQSRTLAQVALANFGNSQGLTQLGDSNWAESFESGAALVGTPGSSSLGLLDSGALEDSNVDLTEQLVGLITAQRDFQANAQVITTASTINQTIINIR